LNVLRKLEKSGFTVKQFSEYHYRLNAEFDIFTNDKNDRVAWWDRYVGDRGRRPLEDAIKLAKERLLHRPTEQSKESFGELLLKIGWTQAEIDEAWAERQKVTA
jgi:hypothetical protein